MSMDIVGDESPEDTRPSDEAGSSDGAGHGTGQAAGSGAGAEVGTPAPSAWALPGEAPSTQPVDQPRPDQYQPDQHQPDQHHPDQHQPGQHQTDQYQPGFATSPWGAGIGGYPPNNPYQPSGPGYGPSAYPVAAPARSGSPTTKQIVLTASIVALLIVFSLVMMVRFGDNGGGTSTPAASSSVSADLAVDKACVAADQTMATLMRSLGNGTETGDLSTQVASTQAAIQDLQRQAAGAPNAVLAAAINEQVAELTALKGDEAAADWTAIDADLSKIASDNSMTTACGL